MLEKKELIADINILRENLYRILERHGYDLNDSEVLDACEDLNAAIINYNAFLEKEIS